ncbi:ROK family transcriptional regulator [Glaciihabitans sp. dw_435]|uniref:ROK family transcriptional regulator n=1 Tax=Glaciihabitans sp. dw_435 TaxID=2720081 RepID=UPI001BD3ED13|nr:ROK family transcriptional regulator [Glaciihabitans sp. dw_435]
MSSSNVAGRRSVGGTTTDQLRRANLSTILELVHREGPRSRAEITRLTGLNRSTVGAVVADLAQLGLVSERMPHLGASPGRPSPVVHAADRIVAIAINPEVDVIAIGLVGLGGRVLKSVRIATPVPPLSADVVHRAASAVAGLLAGMEDSVTVVGAGIAVPGQVRTADGLVREATHLGWYEEPLSEMFERAIGVPAFAANAAALAMRAEAVFGVGRDVDDFVYIIGGASGIGGGVVSGGTFLTGSAGHAGEIGHTFVRSSGTRCSCGSSGCFEAEVTQTALLDAVGLRADEIAGLGAALAAAEDDAAREVIAQDTEYLGIAVGNAVNLFNPSVIVLAGFLSALCEGAGAYMESILSAHTIRSARESVGLVPARFGSEQLLIGAAELVFEALLYDPAAFERVTAPRLSAGDGRQPATGDATLATGDATLATGDATLATGDATLATGDGGPVSGADVPSIVGEFNFSA